MKNIHIISTDQPSRLLFNPLFTSFSIQKEDDGMFINDGKVSGADFWSLEKASNNGFKPNHIYITSDDDINQNDYIITKDGRLIQVDYLLSKDLEGASKIILTTAPTLIADGVQAINSEFLEWFIKNPTCEFVEIQKTLVTNSGLAYKEYAILSPDFIVLEVHANIPQSHYVVGQTTELDDYEYDTNYKIIIPQEESKQDLEKEMFELEQELDIPSSMRWHNSKPKQETLEEAAEKLAPNSSWRLGFIAGGKHVAKRMYSEEEVLELLNDCRGENPIDINKWFEQFKKK